MNNIWLGIDLNILLKEHYFNKQQPLLYTISKLEGEVCLCPLVKNLEMLPFSFSSHQYPDTFFINKENQ
jgi:hypothetical protein